MLAGLICPAGTWGWDSNDLLSSDQSETVTIPESKNSFEAASAGEETRKFPDRKVNPHRSVPQFKSVEKLFSEYVRFADKDDFEGMYLLMTTDFQQSYPFGKFYYFLDRDLNISGGLKEITGINQIKQRGRFSYWKATLNYKNTRMHPRTVIVTVKEINGGFKIQTGVMLPLEAQKFN